VPSEGYQERSAGGGSYAGKKGGTLQRCWRAHCPPGRELTGVQRGGRLTWQDVPKPVVGEHADAWRQAGASKGLRQGARVLDAHDHSCARAADSEEQVQGMIIA